MSGAVWILVCREGDEDRARTSGRVPGRAGPALWIPPPLAEVMAATGVWTRLNAELGTLFDLFEEEVVAGAAIERFARALEDEVARLGGQARRGQLRVRIGVRVAPARGEEWVQMAASEVERAGRELARYAREVASEGVGLVVSM